MNEFTITSLSLLPMNRAVISKTLFVMFIRHSEGAVIVVVVARYSYTSYFIETKIYVRN